jgi:hypothetical protein
LLPPNYVASIFDSPATALNSFPQLLIRVLTTVKS